MYTCYYCLQPTVGIDSQCSFDELGYEGNGIVTFHTCRNCGAFIEVYVRFDEEEE